MAVFPSIPRSPPQLRDGAGRGEPLPADSAQRQAEQSPADQQHDDGPREPRRGVGQPLATGGRRRPWQAEAAPVPRVFAVDERVWVSPQGLLVAVLRMRVRMLVVWMTFWM